MNHEILSGVPRSVTHAEFAEQQPQAQLLGVYRSLNKAIRAGRCTDIDVLLASYRRAQVSFDVMVGIIRFLYPYRSRFPHWHFALRVLDERREQAGISANAMAGLPVSDLRCRKM